ncbi:hypothetical protein H9Y04_08750 [Streptomyces sp. TRM66268-LWL]|uniref:Uncharacterized protein n=1 Tax=Streptomyces polyasparticus TaxID=2767826 RepID=A0ABR7SDI7_9ACTN|nr:hypothetical protein [Streptomyces polyasparticus]MBC9712662.1 hypothetical protein [Streptomyces polyasparticus]
MGTNKGESSIPDEEWERFLREAEAGSPGAPEEPSARARMVADRLRDAPGSPEAWRAHRPPRQRRFKAWQVAALLLSVAALIVALTPGALSGNWFGGGDEERPLAAESARPGAAPADRAGERPTPDEPFKGSPAARWADGADGIHVPAARATGWMDEAQVADALKKSRDFLTASNLDPAVLRGDRPEAAIALVSPDQPDVQPLLTTSFAKPTPDNDPLLLFTRYHTDEVELVGGTVKTRGRLSYEEGKYGALEVTADVTFVYPFVRAEDGSDEVTRTIVRRELVLSWDDPSKVRTKPGTFSFVSYKMHTTNGGCDVFGFLSPAFTEDHTTADGDEEIDPYDRSEGLTGTGRNGECESASRS